MNQLKIMTYSKFVSELMQHCAKENGDGNYVISPYSAWLNFKLLEKATEGKTNEEIVESLTGRDEININLNEYKKIISMASALINKSELDNHFDDDFLEHFQKVYNGEIFSSENLGDKANAWIAEKTNNMIRPNIEFDKDALMTIINAIAFEDKWDKDFEEEDIEEKEFNNCDGTKTDCQFLTGYERCYLEDDNFMGFGK